MVLAKFTRLNKENMAIKIMPTEIIITTKAIKITIMLCQN